MGFDFDIAATAGWYSAVAGLLAGFALLAILFPLDHALADDDETAAARTAEAVVVFTCAFFSLLILSVTYAILAGRPSGGDQGRIAAAEQMLNGSAFGLAVLLVLIGLHAILRAYSTDSRVLEPAGQVIVASTAVLGPVVVVAIQFSSALDLQAGRVTGPSSTSCGRLGLPTAVWVDLGIVAAAFLAILALAAARHRLPSVRGAAGGIAKAVLVFTVLVTVITSIVLPLASASVVAGAAFEHGALAVAAFASVCVAAASWLSR